MHISKSFNSFESRFSIRIKWLLDDYFTENQIMKRRQIPFGFYSNIMQASSSTSITIEKNKRNRLHSIMHSELGTLEYLLSVFHDVPRKFLKKKRKKSRYHCCIYIYLLGDITCMYKQRYICLYIINMYTRILTHVHTRIQIYKCQILSCTSMHLLWRVRSCAYSCIFFESSES